MYLEFSASYRPPPEETGRFIPLRFGPGQNAQGELVWVCRFYFRRLLVLLALLAGTGWLLVPSALYLWLDHRPHNQIGWLDLASPWRWSGLSQKRGDMAVLKAMDEIKARDFTGAYYDLRVGLARSPGNVKARLTLAGMQAGYDPVRAVGTMEEGLRASGTDPEFIAGLLGLYGRFQIQSHALDVVRGLLQDPARPPPPASRFLLERAELVLLLQLDRLAEADAVMASIKPPTAAEAAILDSLRFELLVRSGRLAEAAQVLAAHPPAEPLTRFRQTAELAIARGDADALQAVLLRLKAQAPTDASVYLFAVQAWQRMKRASYRDAAEQEYFRVFGHDDAAMQGIAALAVTLDLPEVITRAQEASVAAHHSAFAYRVHQTELCLRRGEVGPAVRLLQEWEGEVDTLTGTQRFYPEFIRRLTHAAAAGAPEQINNLLAFFATNRGQPLIPVLKLSIDILEKSGSRTGAGQVLQAALRLYPQTEPFLQAKAHFAPTGSVDAGAPKEAVAAAGPALPATAAEARSRLTELLRTDALGQARDLLRAIRDLAPAWAGTMQPELELFGVELAYLSPDPIASRAAARAYLDRYRSEDDLRRLVSLAVRLVARDRVTEARLLASEIEASTAATPAIREALGDLKLGDDLAAQVVSQPQTLAKLDQLILAGNWAQADRLVQYLQDKPPEWAAAAWVDLKVREIRVRLGLAQRIYAFAALRDIVLKTGAPRSAAFKLVRDLLARGDRDDAALLAHEIARLLPDDPAVARLVKETDAPPPPK